MGPPEQSLKTQHCITIVVLQQLRWLWSRPDELNHLISHLCGLLGQPVLIILSTDYRCHLNSIMAPSQFGKCHYLVCVYEHRLCAVVYLN